MSSPVSGGGGVRAGAGDVDMAEAVALAVRATGMAGSESKRWSPRRNRDGEDDGEKKVKLLATSHG